MINEIIDEQIEPTDEQIKAIQKVVKISALKYNMDIKADDKGSITWVYNEPLTLNIRKLIEQLLFNVAVNWSDCQIAENKLKKIAAVICE